jgi:hypothetical protein
MPVCVCVCIATDLALCLSISASRSLGLCVSVCLYISPLRSDVMLLCMCMMPFHPHHILLPPSLFIDRQAELDCRVRRYHLSLP